MGSQALVISNKQDIKPTLKSERKTIASISNNDFLQNVENKRPPSSFKGNQGSNGYQKIKRTFGNPEHGQVYEKEILSQLIKQNIKGQTSESNTPLSSMLNYFTMSSNDTKKKVTSKLGLDKLLSS